METTTDLQIAFPKIDQAGAQLDIPAAPVTPVNQGLASIAETPTARKTLVCKNLLVGDTLQQAKNEAKDLYPKMKDNSAVIMEYGISALDGVNDLIDQLLHGLTPVKIPELEELMNNLTKGMRGIKRKYDVSNPEIEAKYEKMKSRGNGFFHKAQGFFDMLMDDTRSLEQKIDKVEKTLTDRQFNMTRNVLQYDALYKQNEIEIGKLIYVVAVMELVRDLAADEVSSIKVGDAALGDRGEEQKARIADLINNLENRISDFKARLFVAWATSPQIRTMRALDVTLALRLNSMITVGIPGMKATIVLWSKMIESKDAADQNALMAGTLNDTLQTFAATSAVVIPQLASTVNSPMLSAQTIFAMADGISKTADGIVLAMEAGAQQREAVDNAIIDAQDVIKSAANKVTDSVVDRVLAASKPLQITQTVLSEPLPAVATN